MNTILKWSGVVALGIIAIILGMKYLGSTDVTVGTADCQSVTCFTTVGILTSLEVDGTATFNGATTFAGATSWTGANTFSGATTMASTTITQLKVGQTGTQATGYNFGTCNFGIGAQAISIPGFTRVVGTCGGGSTGTTALAGVATGDNVMLHMATTTTSTQDSLRLVAFNASPANSGLIDVILYNSSTTAIVLSSVATTSWQYQAWR